MKPVVEKREYPELAGNVVRYTDTDGITDNAVIVACDYHLGYTLVKEKDPEEFLVCAHGPLSPHTKELYAEDPKVLENWDKMWEKDVAGLLAGHLDDSNTELGEYVGGYADANTCSFNQ